MSKSKYIKRVCKWCGHSIFVDMKKHDKLIYNKAINDMRVIILQMRETAQAMMYVNGEDDCNRFLEQLDKLKGGKNEENK